MPDNIFAPLLGRFPGWQCWQGVSGILYARKLKSSPPVIVRSATAEELADRMSLADAPTLEVREKSESPLSRLSIPGQRRASEGAPEVPITPRWPQP
jgi:hypothetical protein